MKITHDYSSELASALQQASKQPDRCPTEATLLQQAARQLHAQRAQLQAITAMLEATRTALDEAVRHPA